MNHAKLNAIRDLIQQDVGQRGLRTDPQTNLVTACADDFTQACSSIAEHPAPAVAIVTGFPIPEAEPPACETDGPLGAIFLARALLPGGIRIMLAIDPLGRRALDAGLGVCGLRKQVPVIVLPSFDQASRMTPAEYRQEFADRAGSFTHLVALERVGPGHTAESIDSGGENIAAFRLDVAAEEEGRCRTMRGRDVTSLTSPVHYLFEEPARQFTTIGIGDGGNEIGMGKIAWEIIRRNIPNGGRIACRVATDWLIVCGVSNWGAYGLGAGVRLLRQHPDASLFDPEQERTILGAMVEHGPLVDGVTARQTASVDGLAFEQHADLLRQIGRILDSGAVGQ